LAAVVLLVLARGVLGPVLTLIIAVVVAAAVTAAAFLAGEPLALRRCRAVAADAQRHARLINLAEGLCASVGVAPPTLLVIECDAANALVVGRSQQRSTLVVTTGLLERASRVELEGVLARELWQIKSGDVAFKTLLVGFVGVPAAAADLALRRWWKDTGAAPEGFTAGQTAAAVVCLPFVAIAPALERLLRAVLPSDDDATLDAQAVRITRYPPGLIGALEKVEEAGAVVWCAGRAAAHLWAAEPLPVAAGDSFASRSRRALGTHLPLGPRIDALREL
jgi:heat shock protein HtpX